MDSQVKIFRLSKATRIVGYGCCLLLSAAAIWFILIPFVYKYSFTAPKTFGWISAGIACALLCWYLYLETSRSRLELAPDRLRGVGAFKAKEYLLSALKGYKVHQTQGGNFIELVRADSGKKAGMLSLAYENIQEIGLWLDAHLENLDLKVYKEEMSEILNDVSIGNTEEERLESLRRAWRWGGYLNKASVACMVWGMAYPKPYEAFFFTALSLPLIGLAVVHHSRGAFRMDGNNKSAHPVIFPVLFVPPMVLALRAMLDWEVYAWATFWTPFSICSAVFFLLVYKILPDVRQTRFNMAVVGVMAMIYGYGAAIGLNGLSDAGEPLKYTTTIVSKHSTTGKYAKYDFVAEHPKGSRQFKDFSVSRKLYNTKAEGDPIEVHIHTGRLGIPWVHVK